MGFNDFTKNDKSASPAHPVALETEEQKLEREHNERDVLEALGENK